MRLSIAVSSLLPDEGVACPTPTTRKWAGRAITSRVAMISSTLPSVSGEPNRAHR